MTTFSDWLKSELLRLKTLDWQGGSWSTKSLPAGMMKCSGHYSLSRLAKQFGMSEDEIATAIQQEVTGKQFAVERKEDTLTLFWVEDGIREVRWDVTQNYTKEDFQVPGKMIWKSEYYQGFRWVEKIVYLDGKERVLREFGSPNGEPGAKISKETFEAALEQIMRANGGNKSEAGEGPKTT